MLRGIRGRRWIRAHRRTASDFSRRLLDQHELFLPLRDLFSLIQCRLDRITKLPAGSLSRRVPQGGFGASYAPYPSVVSLQVRKDRQGSDKEFQLCKSRFELWAIRNHALFLERSVPLWL